MVEVEVLMSFATHKPSMTRDKDRQKESLWAIEALQD